MSNTKWRDHAENSCVRIEAYSTVIDFTRPDIVPRQGGGTGTGFFIPSVGKSNWYSILTCAHVVMGCHASEICIIFPKYGRQKFKAVIQSVCPDSDLAVIVTKIEDHTLQNMIEPMKMSNEMPVGCSVSAYGYPLGQWGLTGSTGEYGAFQSGQYQHNADISPGNSGGPLIRNDTGEVVGVNASTMVGGAASGVHYAVPIALYQRMAIPMLTGSREPVMPPRMGFCYHASTPALIEKIKQQSIAGGGGESEQLDVAEGMYIHYVFKNSCAAEMGISPGSIVQGISWETGNGNWSDEHHLDRHGETRTSFSGTQRIAVEHLLERIPIMSKVRVRFLKNDKGTITNETSEGLQKCLTSGSFRMYSSPLEAIPDYCFFGGMCVMSLCANHGNHFPLLFSRMSPEQREMKNLIVTTVLPNYADNPIRPGSIIQFVNKKGNEDHFEEGQDRMDTLEKYRKAICDHDGFLTIIDTSRRNYTLHMKDILDKEHNALENNIYNPDTALLKCLK